LYSCRLANRARTTAADAVYRRQRDFRMLMIWNVYATNPGHVLPQKRKTFDFNA
jgi:hypothetical protein